MNKNQDLPTATQIKAPGLVRRAVVMGVLPLVGMAVLAGCSMAVPEAQSTATPAPSGTELVPAGSTAPESGLDPGEQEELDQRLIRAAKDNDVELVRELIAAGGNVNAKDSLEDSAFLYAGAEGFNEILELTI